MACTACGLPVARRIDDCSLWQAVWLAPDAVCRLPVEGAVAAPPSWKELMEQSLGTPPFEPISTWGSQRGTSHYWSWSPQWEAAAGLALAHLLAASQGGPVTVPDCLAKAVFQRALDALLPAGPSVRRAVLTGPGRPTPGAEADILIVPIHPQTGEVWAPASSAYRVPLPFGVWRSMVSPEPGLPVPTTGSLPDGVLRDDFDAPAMRPNRLFRADPRVFQHTLVRLPAVRSPWLRDVAENLTQHMLAGLF